MNFPIFICFRNLSLSLRQGEKDSPLTANPEDFSPRTRLREAKAEILLGKELKELDPMKSLEHYRRGTLIYFIEFRSLFHSLQLVPSCEIEEKNRFSW
jgi:hypothetical protein